MLFPSDPLTLQFAVVPKETPCGVCGKPECSDRKPMLLCHNFETCGTVCHCHCLTPRIRCLPVGDWFCSKVPIGGEDPRSPRMCP